MFTRRRMQEMNEAELRQQVLKPLLKAIGYHDVFEYHGGAGEQGKDIVGWKLDELGARINLAIVAKAVRLSGKASVIRGAAGEVSMQVRQCFGKPFTEPVRGEEQAVHQCWVVSNQSISKEAEDAIKSGLASDMLARNLRFVDGDRLWELVEKHLPTTAVLQKLQDAGHVFETLDAHYRVRARTAPFGVELGIEEKFPGAAAEKPFTIHSEFRFPDTEEGRAAREAFERHLSTGAPVDIPSTFAQLTFPDFLQVLVGDTTQFRSLKLGPAGLPQSLLVRIDIFSEDGDTFSLNYVDLKAVQAGREQVTLTNEHQPVPTRVRMVIELTAQYIAQCHLEMNSPLYGLNVKQILEGTRLQQAMSKVGTFRVTHLDTGLQIFEAELSPENAEGRDGLDPEFVAAMQDLVAVQTKVQRPINLPERELSEDEMQSLNMLRYILRDGETRQQWETLAITVSAEAAQGLLRQFGNGDAQPLRLSNTQSMTLFGVELPLGPVRVTVERCRLVNGDEVAMSLEQSSNASTGIQLRFEPADNDTLVAEYLDWLKQAPDIGEDSGLAEQGGL